MTSTVTNPGKTFARIALALAIAAMGVYVASSDPPGGAVVGFLLMLAAVLFGVRTARSRLPTWAGRTAVAVGALIAAFAAFLIHSIKIEAPLFAQAPGVPSVSASAPSPQLAPAVDRAPGKAPGWSAGSLSIEPFGPSRWRLRRTRPFQLCPFNRTDPARASVVDGLDAQCRTVTTRPARERSRASGVTAAVGQTSGARAYVRDTMTPGGPRATTTTCHGRCRRGAT